MAWIIGEQGQRSVRSDAAPKRSTPCRFDLTEHASVLALQRSVGNSAVTQLLARPLSVQRQPNGEELAKKPVAVGDQPSSDETPHYKVLKEVRVAAGPRPLEDIVPLPDISSDDRTTAEAINKGDWGGSATVQQFCERLAGVVADRLVSNAALVARQKASAKATDDGRKQRLKGLSLSAFVDGQLASFTFDGKGIREKFYTDRLEELRVGLNGTLKNYQHTKGDETFAVLGARWMGDVRGRSEYQTSFDEKGMRKDKFFSDIGTLQPNAKGKLEPIVAPGSGTDVAPFTNKFLKTMSYASTGNWRAFNYAGHGMGDWKDSGYCLDMYCMGGGKDERDMSRQFFPQDDAIDLILQIDSVATDMGAEWRICYNDWTVASAINKFFGKGKVVYAGETDGRNNHGPLNLHMHLDLRPPDSALSIPQPHDLSTEPKG